MTRITVNDVEAIADFRDLKGSDLQEFVDEAHDIVDDRLEGRLSERRLTIIEKWVAAHLASMLEKRVHEDALGDSTKVYEGDEYGMGFESTRYGQMALAFDSTGLLDSLDPVVVSNMERQFGEARGAESGSGGD